MKVLEVKEKLSADENIAIELMRNPAKLAEWVIWIRESSGKSFLLMNELDVVISSCDMNQVILLLREIGIKHANIVL